MSKITFSLTCRKSVNKYFLHVIFSLLYPPLQNFKKMKFELTGVLYEKYDSIQRTATFKVREFILEHTEDVNGKSITNYIKFQCTQDRVALLDSLNPGDKLRVTFSIRGSKWEKNGQVSYFNNLDAWRIESASEAEPKNQPEDLPGKDPATETNDHDDLPF